MDTKIGVEILRKIDAYALVPLSKSRSIYYLSKRIMDFFLSMIVLILLFPLIAIIAVLIKLDSPGSIFFRQERVGVRRRVYNHVSYWQKTTFQCYKFRTMVCNADPSLHKSYMKAFINNDHESMAALQGGETHIRKLVNDQRVTRFGRFLRKSSIDEIPQFINVVRGEMSLVGPRPAIPYEVEMYKPWHYRRLEAQPGITGLWQVTARSSVDFDEIINLDIQYIDQQSFWLDLKILLKTPKAVLLCKGSGMTFVVKGEINRE